MALFLRRIGGRYAMLGRQGGVNITLMFSDDVHCWEDYEVLLEPEAPWEYVQIGNCGPPLETEAGWLVLTHGVGAMRNYYIGAALLDLDDPRRVIGRSVSRSSNPRSRARRLRPGMWLYSRGSRFTTAGWCYPMQSVTMRPPTRSPARTAVGKTCCLMTCASSPIGRYACRRRATRVAFPEVQRTWRRIVMMRRHREQQVREPNSIDAAVDRIGDAADFFADADGFAAGLPEVSPAACSAYHLRLR